MQLIKIISFCTRWLQRLFPHAPIKGMSRLSRILRKSLPVYEGVVQMNPQFKMRLSSRHNAEMDLIMLGSYQVALYNILVQQLEPDAYCLDVGANLGYFSLCFAKFGGKVAVFEANPAMVARIRDAVALNDFSVDIVEKVVDTHSGKDVVFYVSTSPGTSSIYADNVQEIQQAIHLHTISIDDYIQENAWSKVDIIKMDIEGNDCFGLLGAEQTIRQHRPFIVFEYSGSTSDVRSRLQTIFDDSGYRLEILFINGKRQAFDWDVPQGLHHVDVLAFPL